MIKPRPTDGKDLRMRPAGDRTLMVELGAGIDDAINTRVLVLTALLRERAAEVPGLLAVVPAYRSLSLSYEPLRLPMERLSRFVRSCARAAPDAAPAPRRWEVPVCYGGDHGEDLQTLADACGLSPREVIALHSAPVYRVYMVGFLPGFAYLGGLHARLHTPRRASPRANTPRGSINIGGQQTAIASVAGPSGWHLLGRTPWRSFDLRCADPFLFNAGDEVVFRPIDAQEFARLDALFDDPVQRPQPSRIRPHPALRTEEARA